MQKVLRAALVLAAAGSVAVSGAALIEEPVAVSPGSATGMAVVEARCPSFSWGAVPDAEHYELEILRIDDSNTAEAVLRQEVHGAAASWTPALGKCLSPGGRYAWSIRAMSKSGGAWTAWSEPSLFQIAERTGRVEVEDALDVLRSYLAVQGRAEVGLGAEQRLDAENVPAEPPPIPMPSVKSGASFPSAAAATQMTVDGGIVAASFTGDGSTLTDLNPSNLAPGSAAIDISGNAATATTASDSDTLDGKDSVAFVQKTEADSEAELEALLTDVTNVLTDSETAAAAMTATTAAALAADPAACPTGTHVKDIAADGTLTCGSNPAGLDFSAAGSRTLSSPAVNVCHTYSQLTSIVVTVPATSNNSFVVCTASGEADFNQLDDLVRVGIDSVPNATDTSTPDRSRVLEALSLSSEEDRTPWSVRNVYTFSTAGGSQRYALKACRQTDSNTGLVIWDPLVCIVVPQRR